MVWEIIMIGMSRNVVMNGFILFALNVQDMFIISCPHTSIVMWCAYICNSVCLKNTKINTRNKAIRSVKPMTIMDQLFHPALHNGYNHLSANPFSQRGPRWSFLEINTPISYQIWKWIKPKKNLACDSIFGAVALAIFAICIAVRNKIPKLISNLRIRWCGAHADESTI